MDFLGDWNTSIYFSQTQHAARPLRLELSNLSQLKAILLVYFLVTIVSNVMLLPSSIFLLHNNLS